MPMVLIEFLFISLNYLLCYSLLNIFLFIATPAGMNPCLPGVESERLMHSQESAEPEARSQDSAVR